MRTVEDEAGRRYLLLKRSGESSLVREVATGEERYVPNDDLADLDGVDPLEAAAGAVQPPLRRLVSAVHDDRGLGLLVALSREPRSARALLDATDLCESDLVGLLAELRAAGLIEEATVGGERGYAATEDTREAVEVLSGARLDEAGSSDDQSADAPSPETSE